MKLQVTRTSQHEYNEPPCDEAHAEYFIITDNVSEQRWFVNFETLEDLMAFVGKYRQCVIRAKYIEIYDDYRE